MDLKQLPELKGPNNTVTVPRPSIVQNLPFKRNPYLSKWHMIFENRSEQWIAFQPQMGRTVYPCFACRSMFGSKQNFVDHVNRRCMIFKYKCVTCRRLLIFYNPCSLLVHTRFHFTDNGGSIDLEYLEFSSLPLHMAGVLPLTNIPRLYENVDESIVPGVNIPARFYLPVDQCEGKRVVHMITNDLVFLCSNALTRDNSIVALTLKQVNLQIPRCEFIPLSPSHQYSLKITNLPNQLPFFQPPAAILPPNVTIPANAMMVPLQFQTSIAVTPAPPPVPEIIYLQSDSDEESDSTATSTPTTNSTPTPASEVASLSEFPTVSEPAPVPDATLPKTTVSTTSQSHEIIKQRSQAGVCETVRKTTSTTGSPLASEPASLSQSPSMTETTSVAETNSIIESISLFDRPSTSFASTQDTSKSKEETEPPPMTLRLKDLNLLLDERQSTPLTSDEETRPNLATYLACPVNSRCPECSDLVSSPLKEHFLGMNRPYDDAYKCSTCEMVASSACSLNAHKRLHEYSPPYVCPECGDVFKTWPELDDHLEKTCYHRAKSIRYKCPGKKCGKIFAQCITFTSHFPSAHFRSTIFCEKCQTSFPNSKAFDEHCEEKHPTEVTVFYTVQQCTVCDMPLEHPRDHVIEHVSSRDNRIYVYVCKSCRGYYRSKYTFTSHLQKCSKLLVNTKAKRETELSEHHNGLKCKIVKYCKQCNLKKQFFCTYKNIRKLHNNCSECGNTFSSGVMYKLRTVSSTEYTDNIYVRRDPDTSNLLCILCNTVLKNNDERISHRCKYNSPMVCLSRLPGDYNNNGAAHASTSRDSSSSMSATSPDERAKRKRKRPSTGNVKIKRANFSESVDMTLAPIVFDGEYKCSLCSYRDKSRTNFHSHIITHRDISTAYQCMECGECFVVKPSLAKHLQAVHSVEDIQSYLNNNECFDKAAVRELAQNMRLLPGELKETVAEHQCRICGVIFSDGKELSKHFRVHGMAFLMKNIIK